MSSAKKFLTLELVFLLGIALNGLFHGRVIIILCAAFLGLGAFLTLYRRFFMVVLCMALMIGVVRPLFTPTTKPLTRFADQVVTVRGTIAEEIDRRLEKQKFVLAVKVVTGKSGPQAASGRVLVSTELYPEYAYGEEIEARCTLERPGVIDGFAYDRYLALSDIFLTCQRARITVLLRNKGNPLIAPLLSMKGALLGAMSARFPEPQASLLAGLLVGARRGIPADVLTAFQQTGITHIIALSGFNITILATATFAFVIRIGLHRRHAFWVVVAVLAAFLFLTGAPSSVLRACIMGICMLLGRQLGRPSNIWYALMFAASIMVALHPRILLDDVGFQLSFCATLGLVLLSKRVEPMVRFLPEPFGIRASASAALAATAFTIPITMTRFGFFSTIAPLTNILVVPFIPVTMLLGFLSIFPFVGTVIAPITSLLLTWIIMVPETLARIPFSSMSLARVPAWVVPACYVVLAAVFSRKRIQQFLVSLWLLHLKHDDGSSSVPSRPLS